MNKLLKTSNIRLLSALLATALAIPLGWKSITGLYNWFSPFIMLNSVFALKSMVWLNVLGLMVLVISFFRKRWFCRFLCPVGFGCDTVSKWGRHKRFSLRRIPRFGRWIALFSLGAAFTGVPFFILLDPMAIFHGFFSVFSAPVSLAVIVSFLGLPLLLLVHLFFPNIWCARLCPLGGLQDETARVKDLASRKKRAVLHKVQVVDTGRRLFIAGGTGLVVGLFIPQWLRPENRNHFRPPASVSPDKLNTLCIRCGNCIKACPTNIIIHHTGTKNIKAWMTPEVSFENSGYCIEDCNLCGSVCPSGAISPFDVEAKKELFIASIEINLDKCLLTEHTECDRCKAVCSYNTIEIVPGNQPLTMMPVVDTKKCVGCGACAAVCPPLAIDMVALE